jgi:hypothetical protein
MCPHNQDIEEPSSAARAACELQGRHPCQRHSGIAGVADATTTNNNSNSNKNNYNNHSYNNNTNNNNSTAQGKQRPS